MIAGTAFSLFFIFWGCAAFAGWMARRFGVRWKLGGQEGGEAALCQPPGLSGAALAISIVSFLLTPANNAFSRYFEHQADVYGQEAIHGLVRRPAEDRRSRLQRIWRSLAGRPQSQPLHRVLGV